MRALTIYLSLSIAAISYTGTSYAQVPTTNNNVNIVYLSADPSADDDNPEPATPLSAETERQAQAEIQADPELRATLEQQNVQLNNVVGIETAGDGSKIVYVK